MKDYYMGVETNVHVSLITKERFQFAIQSECVGMLLYLVLVCRFLNRPSLD